MVKRAVLPATKLKRGNPNWGKPLPPLPVIPTEFETEVRRLHLRKGQYAASAELRRWCERNRNRCYVPELLLEEWGFEVEATFSGVA